MLALSLAAAEPSADPDFELFGDEFAAAGAAADTPVYDPLIALNRAIFKVNDFVYLKVIEPVARGYASVTPEGARIGVRRFFNNLGWPVRVVNHCLQGRFRGAGTETKRFAINTTVGVLGFRDPALNRYNLEPIPADFGLTLASYGIGGGPAITLPLLGPSNLRDALSKFPDHFLNPVSYIDPWQASAGVRIYEVENGTSLRLGQYGELKEAALDPYVFFRDAYAQNRDKRIGD